MRTKMLFASLVLLAALLPVWIRAAQPPLNRRLEGNDLPWPISFEGQQLRRLPLSTVDQRFADRFPGHIARFTDGRRILIMRAVLEPTPMLHSAAVCFRSLGYAVEAPYAVRDAEGVTWACFGAQQAGKAFFVCERIYDTLGGAWNDVPSWYWAAILGRTKSPWYALTVVSQR